MHRHFILLAFGFLLLGCVTSPASVPASSPSATASIAASPVPSESAAAPEASASVSTYPSPGVATTYPTYDAAPRVSSSSARPSNPDRNEPFTLDVTAVDDVGLKSVSWMSPDSFSSQPQSASFDCGLQKSCSASFTFQATAEGKKTVVVYATDSSGQDSPGSPMEFNIRPFDYKAPTATPTPAATVQISSLCGNGACDSSESAATCSADCAAATATAEPTTAACTSNEACGRKQICQDGACVDVDCTNDSHCGYGKRCSYNSCVRCRSGPYGPAC